MPDWKVLVRKNLGADGSRLNYPEAVITELAAHLEETYESARAKGLADDAAVQLTLQQVADWNLLAKEIRRTKSREELMNTRTRTLWLPTLVTLLGASTSLMALQRSGFQPRQIWIGGMGMCFYWPWLAGLVGFGALGAWLSRRSQGAPRTRVAAGLSPALVMLITMSIILPFGLAIDGFSFFRLVHFGLGLVNWVAIPGLALVLGALPFLTDGATAKAEPDAAN